MSHGCYKKNVKLKEERTMKKKMIRLVSSLAIAFAIFGSISGADAVTTLNGAGATFPYPIYSKWFDEYNKMHPDVRINYQSIGSGGGIRQMLQRTVDFGATDGPMKDSDLQASNKKIYHIPTVLGAVVPVYNVAGVKDLRITGPVLADIFLGKITDWNDPALTKLNPSAHLPSKPITVVHRADGSGTTFAFVDYLSKVSNEWKSKVGAANSVKWPVGLGGKGN